MMDILNHINFHDQNQSNPTQKGFTKKYIQPLDMHVKKI